MISSAYPSPGLTSFAGSPNQDAASGLAYATLVLETDGFTDVLAVNEAPRLAQAAGNNLISHAVLQAQIDDAARVVAAADPASAAVVQRLRASTAALAEPPRESLMSQIWKGLPMLGGILSVVLGILPSLGFFVSPWAIVGVLALSVVAYLGQWLTGSSEGKKRERQVAEHEEAILALLRRADELRAVMAQQARQTAHVGLDMTGMTAQQ